jgi:formate-nitrite transporter family protein
MPALKTRKPNAKAGKQEADVHAATEERLAEEGTKLTSSELESVEERLRLRAAIVYEIIRQEGEEELSRPASGLAWSGFSAGVTISFSLVAQALLHVHLPDASWRPLVESLGYTVGFVLVIMARQQLFTENTITAVLPLLAQQSLKNLALTARLWGIVLLAHLAGAFVFAALMWSGHFFDPPVNEAMRDVARHFVDLDWDGFLFRGIISGWLIAMLV